MLPLPIASLFPLLGNAVSLARHRRLDIFGVMVLIGLAAGVLAALLVLNQAAFFDFWTVG